MGQTLRLVAYAVNGSGVGHLTRLVGVGRWLRRYAACAGTSLELWFLTSSEADGMLFAEGMASFKLPSKTAVAEAGVDKLAYLALAKQWVWHSLALLRPSLLLVDTFPRGSFGELLSALDLAQRRAFIYRPLRDSLARKPDFQGMLPLYDLLLVPEDPGVVEVPVPEAARPRLRHVGPMGVRERAELLPRGEVRRRLGIPEQRLALYISAGGGGDPLAEARLLALVDALDGQDLELVVGAGPLYRGARPRRPGVTWLCGEAAAELMLGFDGAVAAAGYNTFFELMHAGVPTVFMPQPKVADEQRVRAARAVAAGAATLLDTSPEGEALARAVLDFLGDGAARQRAARAARELVPRNGARLAAAHLLRLCLPPARVEAAQRTVDDQLLAASRELGLSLEQVFELMQALDPGGGEDAALAEEGPAGAGALALLRRADELGVPLPVVLRLGGALGRKLLRASPAERAAALAALLEALLPFDDWAGAVNLLRLLGNEKRLPGTRVAEELLAFLELLRTRGEDLYQGIARLSAAQGAGRELPGPVELLRAAHLELRP